MWMTVRLKAFITSGILVSYICHIIVLQVARWLSLPLYSPLCRQCLISIASMCLCRFRFWVWISWIEWADIKLVWVTVACAPVHFPKWLDEKFENIAQSTHHGEVDCWCTGYRDCSYSPAGHEENFRRQFLYCKYYVDNECSMFSSLSSAHCTLITGWQVDHDSVADLLVGCTGEVDEPNGL